MSEGKNTIKKRLGRLSSLNKLLLLTLLVTVLTVLLAFVLGGKEEAKEEEALDLSEIGFKIKSSEAGNYYPLSAERLLWIDGAGLALLNVAGAETKRINTPLADPMVAVNGDYYLVAEFDGYKYFLLDAKGLVYQGKTEDPIKSVALSSAGQLALVLERAETKGVLRVFDAKGVPQFDWVALDKVKSGFILGAGFSGDGARLYVSLLNTDSDISFPVINVLSLFHESPGDKMVSFLPQNCGPVTILQPLDKSRTLLASSNSLAMADADGGSAQLNFARIKQLCVNDETVFLLAAKKENESLGLYSWNGRSQEAERVGENNFGEGAIFLHGRGHYFAVAENNTMQLYSAQNKQLLRNLTATDAVIAGQVDPNGDVLYVTRHEVKRIKN